MILKNRRDDVTIEVDDVTSDDEISVLNLCSAPQKTTTHIAKDHHDTSEGAVHTFTGFIGWHCNKKCWTLDLLKQKSKILWS